MFACRRLIAQRHLAVLLCAAALLLKLVVPTGYMIDSSHGRIAITVCSGIEPSAMAMEMPAAHGNMPDHGKPKDHGRTELPCAFAGLSAAALCAVDPVQLLALIAFFMATGLAGIVLPAPLWLHHLRPPPRGPPALL